MLPELRLDVLRELLDFEDLLLLVERDDMLEERLLTLLPLLMLFVFFVFFVLFFAFRILGVFDFFFVELFDFMIRVADSVAFLILLEVLFIEPDLELLFLLDLTFVLFLTVVERTFEVDFLLLSILLRVVRLVAERTFVVVLVVFLFVRFISPELVLDRFVTVVIGFLSSVVLLRVVLFTTARFV